MEYKSFDLEKYYADAKAVVESFGLRLLSFSIERKRKVAYVKALLVSTDASIDLGLDDCAKVHRVLQSRLEALLASESSALEVQMEVSTAGIDHNIKNAAEFALLMGRRIRVWDKTRNDWVRGTVLTATENSVTLSLLPSIEKTEKNEKSGGGAAPSECSINFSDIAKAKFA